MKDSRSLFQVLIAAILPYLIVSQENPNWNAKVDQMLQEDLKTGNIASIFVSFTPTTSILQEISSTFGKSYRREQIADLVWQELDYLAKTDQRPVINLLREFSDYRVKFTSLWLTNRLYIENCNLKLANLIINDSKLTWLENDENPNFQLLQQYNYTRHDDYSDITWGLQKIEIQKAWELVGGAENAGVGAIVGIMDTGFNINTALINSSFLEDYGWYDPSDGSRGNPVDWNGHGTHVTGTIVGKKGIGVAPGAKFMSCRACDNQYACPRIYIEKCADYFLCPTKSARTGDGCGKIADVVNISFGTYQTTSTWFEAIVEAWSVAGIIPVVAAGNGGRKCKSLYYPGTLKDVLTVGASTKYDAASKFTSFGPVDGNKYLKPDFVAPGSSIMSAGIPNWHEYWWSSGTSSASAHVTGLVAIMRGKNKEVKFQTIRSLISSNSDFLHPQLNVTCANLTDDDKPNFKYGFGRINAYKTILALK